MLEVLSSGGATELAERPVAEHGQRQNRQKHWANWLSGPASAPGISQHPC